LPNRVMGKINELVKAMNEMREGSRNEKRPLDTKELPSRRILEKHRPASDVCIHTIHIDRMDI
jgi:hypothetical protein